MRSVAWTPPGQAGLRERSTMSKRESVERLSRVSADELDHFRQLDAATQRAVLDAMGEPLSNPRLAARDRAIAKARIKAYRRVMKSRKSGR
jgi:hypothetical protein